MFEPVKFYGNLSEGIVNQIMHGINNGELKPGDKLPPEREMCTMFSVSRTVIRDALKMLVGLGVVTIRHGMGAYINEVDGAEDVSRLASLLHISQGTIEELFQVREVLESQAVIWCTQNANEQDLRQLEHIVRKGKELGDAGESKLALLDAEFHLKIAEAAGNRVQMRLMINLLDLLGEIRSRTLKVPGRQRLSVLDHETIVEAINQRNPELARQRMLSHLANVREAIQSVAHAHEDWD
ncbi:FadR/GntR family transcriptional regulator [Desulfosporosinus sp. BICA1-9]|uniref:FadR/GntR family transcriptional regulator n=1 Tax=Desulfosporosinus sp. BICA1-9 TaxID=1531958 RepID=UPI00054C2E87|nr:FadR/GntR family transcriptional regulator [Desulfosporosinus sp. BICA1-9]KJS49484.1 MAG: GntR family transcriptional regulator [Peptococcaceae bacterium BRH_c23]KJS82476.1 MAG: GntR family transcriptional regulator [Desulfosporosinus sp. BICA1-9]HBW38974.1 FadR family transcriptional regulator [Desulfosporosinus sp.]